MDHLPDIRLMEMLTHYDKCKCDQCQVRVKEIKDELKRRETNVSLRMS